jgi:predicted transcriptional regulator
MGLPSKKPYRRWSKKESDQMLQLLESQSKRVVALKLKRSLDSIDSMQRRLGVNSKMYGDSFSKHQLAALLHIRQQTVQKWIDDGLLTARIEGSERARRIVIETEEFARFCKQHQNAILRGHVREDRLEFVFKFVFPRSHVDLLPVRQAKKEREAYASQMEEHSEDYAPDEDFADFEESGMNEDIAA